MSSTRIFYSLSCRDLGFDDDFACSGKSRADVISRMIRYIYRVYGVDPRELKIHLIRNMRQF